MNAESQELARLREARAHGIPWRKWGPYLSERQWGTVREDYSRNGDAWNHFTHDQARSRAYRSGEDGIAGFCDEGMRLCFALGFWNGKDLILKERLFGLTNGEGNHGEDVKECYFYLDSTPTYSYAKMLYKYPQAAFPDDDLLRTNGSRSRQQPEYELIDTGVFDEDRYFDVFVEYAKAGPEDILIRISVVNRGPEASSLSVLPQLWFRNTWWERSGQPVPSLVRKGGDEAPVIVAEHAELGRRYLHCERPATILFTDNETNTERLFGMPNATPFVKDGINNFLVHGERGTVNPEHTGTKAAALYQFTLAPGATQVIRLRLADRALPGRDALAGPMFDATLSGRQREADEFYATVIPGTVGPEATRVARQGFAGMLWSKQVYIYEVNRWLKEHRAGATGDGPVPIRNNHWLHMDSCDVISMPDKWEYPWFAAWDLAFHAMPLALVDPDFAGQQLELMLRERYLHPNGQMPAYEWNFGDVNPPVHAWAAIFNYRLAQEVAGDRALETLKSSFHKLLLNFTWWVNRKDRQGRNVFEGGFLGLDNIGVFDRSAPLPTGGYLEQADGTAWMALFAQNMLEISLELALRDPTYENLAVKFYEHFVWIASAMGRLGDAQDSMWDEEDGFYYDVLKLPDGRATRLKVRSMVGLLPLCAVTVYSEDVVLRLRDFMSQVTWFNHSHAELLAGITSSGRRGPQGNYMLSILNETRLRRVLSRVLDPNEFLSDYGVRSLSRYHLEHPYIFRVGSEEYRVSYLPGESDTGMFGGNSNWRGPIWLPMNALLIRALLQMYSFHGNDFRVECPTGSGTWMNLFEVAREVAQRVMRIFLPDRNNRRAVYGNVAKFQQDPHWRDYCLFYEYFHGDTGQGLGASHQTGWTGLASVFTCLFERVSAEAVLQHGLRSVVTAIRKSKSVRPAAPGPDAALPKKKVRRDAATAPDGKRIRHVKPHGPRRSARPVRKEIHLGTNS